MANTINEAIEEVQTAKANVAEALINNLGVLAQDILDSNGLITSYGLQDSEGNLKSLSNWSNIINNTTPRTIWGQPFNGTLAIAGNISEVGNVYFKTDGYFEHFLGLNGNYGEGAGLLFKVEKDDQGNIKRGDYIGMYDWNGVGDIFCYYHGNGAEYTPTLLFNVKSVFTNDVLIGTGPNDHSILYNGGIELYASQPYVDFHHGNNGDDYTLRLIEYSSYPNTLSIDAIGGTPALTFANSGGKKMWYDSSLNAWRFDGDILINEKLIRGVETSGNINTNKAINYIERSDDFKLNVSELYSGQELTIIIKNTAAKSIIVEIPNTSPYVNLDEENLEIESGKFGEISILCIEKSNSKIYLISSKS